MSWQFMRVGILMDPISQVDPKKDTSFALCLAAQKLGGQLFYVPDTAVFVASQCVQAAAYPIAVQDKPDIQEAVRLGTPQTIELASLDLLLIRKDPPFDAHYLYLTQILEHASLSSVKIVNAPGGLRTTNEKLATLAFPQCCPVTYVSSDKSQLRSFLDQEERLIVKPLDGMGGRGVFVVKKQDKNTAVILETLTQNGRNLVMAQQFLPEIAAGDKRVLLLHGRPVAHALVRVPDAQDFRGNIASGASTYVQELTERDRWICDQVSEPF
eukprot:TRINITY_DN26018_c0_g1_i1.p2 TRINITY_DN26018_c0_g1~~TRINITY_DN26018_c0_g1_i1.p2  ORF type:complete len:269 (+),score=-46.40 TRINITY_DN26018_c0_g1_i1:1277-2083(+)